MQISPLAIITIIFFFSSSENPQDLIKQAQDKILSHNNINYIMTGFYPNPMGEIDTLQRQSQFQKSNTSLIGYDYIIKSKNADEVNVEGTIKYVNHRERNVELFPKNKPNQLRSYISKQSFITYSPITLINQKGWQYTGNTLINGKSFKDFRKIESDTIIDGNAIYTELQISINQESKLIEKLERRNYFKNKLSQTITFEYEHYNFDNGNFSYQDPTNYKSVIFGADNTKQLAKVGSEAPIFFGKDLQNNPFNLADYRGKKVLLNFSVINCGYCKLALEHINEKDYQLSDNVSAVYINPLDEQDDVLRYVDKMNIPFTVISQAKKIGETYGVSGYPTFFLIDENGQIEKTVVGYDKAFIENLKN